MLQSGSKVIKLTAGDSWAIGDTDAIGFKGVDHVDVQVAAVFTAKYGNVYDASGALLTAETETLDPCRYEAAVESITVTSGVVRLIQA